MEAITKWQDATGDTLRELGRSVQTIPQDIYQLEEKYKLLKSEMDSRVSRESDSRTREVEALRQELAMLKSRVDRQPKPASLQDLEAMNVNVRKLADNLQTVKTVLGMKIQSEQKLRISGLEDLQSQINQLKILTGANLKLTSVPRSQLEDLDTGLGWEDLGTYGTTTGTPSSSQNEHSRQRISDGYKPVTEPIREATREESPYAKQGGLKNINMPSPTPKPVHDKTPTPRSPEQGENQNATDRHSPGDVTPDNWRTPRSGGQTPESIRAGNKSTMTEEMRSPGNRSPNRTARKSPQNTGRQSQGYDTGRGEGSNQFQGNESPGNQTPGGTNRSERARDAEN